MVKIQQLIILIILTVIFSQDLKEEKSKMINLILSYVKDTPSTYPNSYNKVINNPTSRTSLIFDSIQISSIESFMRTYNIPDSFINKLKATFYSIKPQMYEKVDFSEKYNAGFTKRLFGIIKKVNNNFILALIKGDTSGQLYPKYTTIRVQKCKKVLLKKDCYYINEKKPKGYTASELNDIEKALDVQFKITLKNNLKNLDTNSQTIISSNVYLYSMTGKIGMHFDISGDIGIKKLRVNYEYNNGIEASYKGFYYNRNGAKPYSMKITERGNLMIIDGNNNKIWETNTEGKGIGPYSIYISEEGNFVLVDSKNYPVWDKDNKFSNYENVIFQDVKVLSNNGKNYAILSNDSSFIAYEDVKKKYDLTCEQIFEREDSDDRGVPPYYAVVHNGYFKVIDSRNDILYQSDYFGNYCKPGSIQISNEGSITVVDCNGKIVWKRY